MKKIKDKLIVFLVSLLIGITYLMTMAGNVEAKDLANPLYIGITELRTLSTPNLGYAIGDPNTNGTSGSAAKIWNIVKYSSSTSNDPKETDMYCLKAGLGFSDTKKRTTYNRSYNMYTERTAIAADGNTATNGLVNGGHYNEILALANILYLPGDEKSESKDTYLQRAGIYADQWDTTLTLDEIKAVQQAAMWYFTNYGEDNNKYDKTENTAWLYYTKDGNTYSSLSGYNPTNTEPNRSYGFQRQQQAEVLYKYLINTAKANASKYASENGNYDTTLTLYTAGNDKAEQPILEIKRNHKFDLALRKYITKVDGVAVANSRVPVIDVTNLKNGTDTTATYKHRKDPVVVKKGAVVTYNITVSNEGNVNGYVNKIVDQLPTGLKFTKLNTAGYTANYDSSANKVTITRDSSNNDKLLAYPNVTTSTGNSYDTAKLDYTTLELTCTVEEAQGNKVLTNVAWISEEQTEDGTVITNQKGSDIDSEPSTTPSVNKDNMENYKGNTANKDTLNDSNYFYKGQQDDDDFEKLITKEITGNYNVNLVKVDKDNQNVKLSGAEFQVTMPGQSATTKTTGTDGTINLGTVNITNVSNPDTITIKETKAPTGYSKLIDTLTLQVQKQELNDAYSVKSVSITSGGVAGATAVLNGNTITITVPDEKLTGKYNVQLEKVDSENNAQKLSGAEFQVTMPGKTSAETKTTNESGIIDLGTVNITDVNNPDTITVKEIKAPTGYNKLIDSLTLKVEKQLQDGQYSAKTVSITSGGVEGTSATISGNTIKIVVPNEKIKEFDLSLRKFITKVNDKTYVRAPQVDTSKLNTIDSNGKKITTATYNHPKTPVQVKITDTVVYTIRVYNEGEVDGYINEITDYLPPELEFAQNNEINKQYEWTLGLDGRTVKTSYLSKAKETSSRSNLIKAYDGKTLSYKDVQIAVTIKPDAQTSKKLTNIAEITNEVDKNGNNVTDRDSQPNNVQRPNDTNLPNYKDDEISKDYVPGQQDDDDFEKIIIKDITGNYNVNLVKVDKDNQNVKLSGAEFQVTLPGQSATTKTTGADGTIDLGTVNITDINNPDTITVKETKAPTGYSKLIDTLTLNVEKERTNDTLSAKSVSITSGGVAGATAVLNGNTITITVPDEKLTGNYKVQLEKVDSEDNTKKLSGAEFQVTMPGKTSAETKTTNEKGIIDLGTVNITDVNNPDTITVKETKAPTGYNKLIDTLTLKVEKQLQDGQYSAKTVSITSGGVEGTSATISGNTIKIVVPNEKIKEFDLSLRKFITKVNDKTYVRAPQVDTSKLNTIDSNGKKITTATYNHPKTPVTVQIKDTVIYTIRVYNEGELDGYANEVTDYLPEELEFLPDNEINKQYEWTLGSDGRTVKTRYLSQEKETASRSNLIKAFDGKTLNYKDVQIAVKVKDSAERNKKLTNLAEITEDKNDKNIQDRDSNTDNVNVPKDDDLPGYKDDEINKNYVPGQQDDDDFEKVEVKDFDLALRKFITKVDNKEVTTRIPQVSYDKEKNHITYNHTKDPVQVVNGNVVTYTIRIFNEGDINGYASLITDDIPEGLQFIPDNDTNKEYRWVMYDKDGKETTDTSKAVKIQTDYLSKAQEKTEGSNLLKAFDPNQEISDTNPDHKDVQVAFKVIEPNGSTKVLVNSAQISDDTDEDGNPIDDIDSIPDQWNEGEDDQDKEYVKLVYFDLALRKWVTQAIVTDKSGTKVTETGHQPYDDPEEIVKVDLNRKHINDVTVKFRYSIRVINEGEIAGYAKEVKDYIPEGLKFVAADNPQWTQAGDNIITTKALENKLLQPGEYADVEVVLTWINNADNMGLKVNTAEISKDYNDFGIPDKDSTPDNKKAGEDDIDDAPVMLSVSTGAAKTYFTLTGIVLITIAGGILLIKKYVL